MSRRKGQDTLSRRSGVREYRSICWVSAEGRRTEKDYFKMEAFQEGALAVRFPRDTHPNRRNPEAVLSRFVKSLARECFREGDEAWLVVDVDEWKPSEFKALFAWEREDSRHHLAISNPKFELFLVMHFEKGNGCTTPYEVDFRLKRHMPSYKKQIGARQFDRGQILSAIENAEAKRACESGLPAEGSTTVHRLARRLLS